MRLNWEQRKAVEHTEGPLMISAGVGTGKTRVITHRIVHLIKNKNIDPRTILALTFTDKAAEEMRSRLTAFTKLPLESMQISTFHSFCRKLLSRYGHLSGYPADITMLDKVDMKIIIRSLLPKLDLEYFLINYDPRSTINDICGFIDRAKNDLVGPDDATAYAKSLDPESHPERQMYEEMALVYDSYQTKLKELGSMDYGDQIMVTCRLLSGSQEVLREVRRNYKYVLVDEFQDTNAAQIELLRLIPGENKNICVVGDENQSIYSFRGVLSNSFDTFQELFPDPVKIRLVVNYRSTKNILSVSSSTIRRNPASNAFAHTTLETENDVGDLIRYIVSENDEDEANAVADFIGQKLYENKQIGLSESMAVLYRAQIHSDKLIKECINRSIPYKVLKQSDLFVQPEIKLIVSYVKVLDGSEDFSYFYYLLRNLEGGLDNEEITTLFTHMHKNDLEPAELFEERNFSRLLPSEKAEWMTKLSSDMAALQRSSRSIPAIEVIQQILKNLGTPVMLMSPSDSRNAELLSNIVRFYNFAFEYCENKDNIPFEEFMRYLNSYLHEGGDPGRDEILSPMPDCVNFLTAHSAKGLEFDTVIIIGLSNRRFPQTRSTPKLPFPAGLRYSEGVSSVPEGNGYSDEEVRIQEERRLFYVAQTRARNLLVLSALERKRVKVSRFVQELLDDPESGRLVSKN